MANSISGGYFPVYPQHDNLPDPDIRTFITNFYRTSDNPDSNELWVSYFGKDAHVAIGNDQGTGEQEIREMRQRMWNVVAQRRHVVKKVFPHRFQDTDSTDPLECELMLFGEVHVVTKDSQELTIPWAGHAVLKKNDQGEKTEWKFKHYRVWLQR